LFAAIFYDDATSVICVNDNKKSPIGIQSSFFHL